MGPGGPFNPGPEAGDCGYAPGGTAMGPGGPFIAGPDGGVNTDPLGGVASL